VKIAGHAHVKAAGHAFQPGINKHRRRQALGGGDGGRYIPVAAGTKGGRGTHHTNNISRGKNKLSHEKYRENRPVEER